MIFTSKNNVEAKILIKSNDIDTSRFLPPVSEKVVQLSPAVFSGSVEAAAKADDVSTEIHTDTTGLYVFV